MRPILALAAFALVCVASPVLAQNAAPLRIVQPLHSAEPWRTAVTELAQRDFQHPNWGVRHAARNHALALDLARAEGLTIDDDVLMAAAYLHDWGGLEPFEVEGTPHQIRSVELAEPFLREAGFPMEKWPAVRDAILGHVPAGQPTTPEGIVLHDADLLDFLGAEGVARLLAATGDEPSMDQSLSWIEGFATTLPDRLITAEARRRAEPRVAWMTAFLAQLRSELPTGTQP
jgi:uncharacterized protein